MTLDRTEIFQNVDREVREQLRQERFENAVVTQILRWAGLNPKDYEKERRIEDPTDYEFTLLWFMHRFPKFPVALGSEKIPFIYEIDRNWDIFLEMLQRPTKSPLFKVVYRWLDATEFDCERDNVGFVFELPSVGKAIVHNTPRQVQPGNVQSRPGNYAGVTVAIGKQRCVWTLEPLRAFIQESPDEWVPRG